MVWLWVKPRGWGRGGIIDVICGEWSASGQDAAVTRDSFHQTASVISHTHSQTNPCSRWAFWFFTQEEPCLICIQMPPSEQRKGLCTRTHTAPSVPSLQTDPQTTLSFFFFPALVSLPPILLLSSLLLGFTQTDHNPRLCAYKYEV